MWTPTPTFPVFSRYFDLALATYLNIKQPYGEVNHFLWMPAYLRGEASHLTSFDFASISGQPGMLEALLGHPGTQLTREGYRPTPLAFATYFGNPLTVELLLNAGMDANSMGYYIEFLKLTPLHYAAISDEVVIAEILVRSGAHVNTVDYNGRTPLHYAGSAAMAKVLLDARANPSVKDIGGEPPRWNLSNI